MNTKIKLLGIVLVSVVSVVIGGGVLIKKRMINTSVHSKFKHALITEKQEPAEALKNILHEVGVAHDGSLASIVAATQKKWLRGANDERWNIADCNEDKKDILGNLFEKLSMTQAYEPQLQRYDYIVFFGAAIGSVRSRMAYLFRLWQQGIRAHTMIVLAGHRKLDTIIESPLVLYDYNNKQLPIRVDWKPFDAIPTTETEMIAMVIDQAEKPKDFEQLRIHFVDAPLLIDANGNTKRPTTRSTIESWLADNPTPGTCLCISSQPYCGYQDAITRLCFPSNFICDVVGPKIGVEKNSVMLDTLARWLYTELDIVKKNTITEVS